MPSADTGHDEPVSRTDALRDAIGRAVGDARASNRRAWLREVALQLAVAAAVATHRVLGGAGWTASPAAAAAFGVLAAAVLLARHLWPTAALVGTGLLGPGPLLVQLVAVPVVGFAVGRRLPAARLWSATAVAVAVSGLLAVATRGAAGDEPWPLELLAWTVFVLVLLVVPVGCGALLGQRRPAGRLLRERNAHLERTREITAARARQQERTRITGEMHDLLGHRLSLLSVHAGALELRLAQGTPASSEQARLIGTTARTALAELHQILHLTRGPAGDGGRAATDPAPGTPTDVAALVTHSREAGLAVQLTWRGGDVADPRVRQAVHRVVREGLTNVHKHAPATPEVLVEVTVDSRRVRATVRNAPPAQGLRRGPGTSRGLVGLEERAALLGGTCRGHSTSDGGFVLTLDVPSAPDDLVAHSPDAPVPGDADTSLDPVDEPPPLHQAPVMTVRRTLALAALAAVLLVPVALLAVLGVLTVLGGVSP